MVPEKPNNELRVGVIGASGWANVSHLPALAGTEGLRVTAVSTSREESAREVAEQWNVPAWHTDAVELAKRDDVDLITVSVKAPLHRSVVEQVVAAGKPVLVEWPMGASPAEAALLAELFESSGTPGFVGLQATVHPVLVELGRRVVDGALGTVVSVAFRSSRASNEPLPASWAYTLQAENGAGMLEILGGHGLSAMLTALGIDLAHAPLPIGGLAKQVKREYLGTDGTTIHSTGPDTAAGVLELDSGIASMSFASGDSTPSTEITIVGTAGRAHARTLPTPDLRMSQPQMAEWTAEIAGERIDAPESQLPLAARNPSRLYEAIRLGRHPVPRAADAVALHRVLDGLRAATSRA
ncbi:Gfo/Idh/MocA family protein [Allokutzneria sp. NRRL B-24872]|uniref:Gfo/Idh/MocA family protein n=1 Tax=Allokutzneria sp. NRRL B-24872 TaxID=1137961 RepID=UPI000A366B8B|nr:Gfo/Idh/MocA family oxidoreductase [Allokutzneria sp. NRRL B-24872]